MGQFCYFFRPKSIFQTTYCILLSEAKTPSDLCSRLEETNTRMKKVSQAFSACEEFFADLQTIKNATDTRTIITNNDLNNLTAHDDTGEQVCYSFGTTNSIASVKWHIRITICMNSL